MSLSPVSEVSKLLKILAIKTDRLHRLTLIFAIAIATAWSTSLINWRDRIGPTGRASGGPRPFSARPNISDGIWPGPPEPDRASRFQFKPDRFERRAGRAGPKTGRARVGFGLFGPDWPSLLSIHWKSRISMILEACKDAKVQQDESYPSRGDLRALNMFFPISETSSVSQLQMSLVYGFQLCFWLCRLLADSVFQIMEYLKEFILVFQLVLSSKNPFTSPSIHAWASCSVPINIMGN